MSASFCPARLSMLMIAPSGRNSRSDCRTTSSWMPAERNNSRVRTWKCAARGTGDPPRRGSTTSAAMPWWARNIAVDRPTRPPPAMITGNSGSPRWVTIAPPTPRPRRHDSHRARAAGAVNRRTRSPMWVRSRRAMMGRCRTSERWRTRLVTSSATERRSCRSSPSVLPERSSRTPLVGGCSISRADR